MSEPRRLHPAAILADALHSLRQAALPILLVAVVGRGLNLEALAIAAGASILTVPAAWIQWTTTRWSIGDHSVRLRRGVLGERVTTIPLDRVQAVDTVHGPVQRLFGVVELQVQSAGGGRRGEIVLRAVTERDAERIREAVRGAAPDGTDAARGAAGDAAAGGAAGGRAAPQERGEPAPEWRLETRSLLVAALTSGSLGVLVPVVAGASQALDAVVGAEDARELLPTTPGEAALLGAAVLVAAWVLSVLGTVVAFASFSVRREGERLRIGRGLVERREASLPVARVHALRIVENPLREPFGLAQVRVETAGYAGEPATAQTLVPLVRRRDVPAVVGALLPELADHLQPLQPLPDRAARRWIVPPMAAAALLAAVAGVLWAPGGLAALALLPAAAAFGLARHRTAGWRLAGHRLVLRSRGLTRTTAAADARRLQRVQVAQTPLQRRARLATVAVDVSSGRTLALRHVDRATAQDLLARLGQAATRGT